MLLTIMSCSKEVGNMMPVRPIKEVEIKVIARQILKKDGKMDVKLECRQVLILFTKYFIVVMLLMGGK